MKDQSIVNFISGHLDLTPEEFDLYYRHRIDESLRKNQRFVVGDARGADTLAQKYLFGKTEKVTIYHMFTSPRNNPGFQTIGGFKSDRDRDEQMTLDSHQDIAWVRPGKERSGTQNNLDRRSKLA